MKTNNITHRALPLSTLNYGEIFSLDGELFMKVNFKDDYVYWWAVALRNGNLIPFSADPIVVWEDASITRRKGKRTKYDKHEAPEIRHGERYCPLDSECTEEHDMYTDLKSSCDNCGQDHRYCEIENKKRYGFCGNWSALKEKG